MPEADYALNVERLRFNLRMCDAVIFVHVREGAADRVCYFSGMLLRAVEPRAEHFDSLLRSVKIVPEEIGLKLKLPVSPVIGAWTQDAMDIESVPWVHAEYLEVFKHRAGIQR